MDLSRQQRHEWRRLFDSASKTRGVTPWKWMLDGEMFGLRAPDSDRMGFVTVQRSSQREWAVEVLIGPRALYDYCKLRQTAAGSDRRQFEQDLQPVPRLEVCFRSSRPPEPWEQELFRTLNLQGQKPEPRFRSFQPGHFPWKLEDDEIRFMRWSLEQLCVVSRRKRNDPALLNFNGSHRFLVREAIRRGGRVDWQDRIRHVPPPEPVSVPIVWNQSDVDRLREMPKQDHVVDVDLFLLADAVSDPGQRPVCTYILLMVHAQSNLVLGAEPMSVVTSLERMWGSVPGVLAASLVNFDIRPRKIRVRSLPLLRLLRPLQQELEFELEQCTRMPNMDSIQETMQEFFQQHVR